MGYESMEKPVEGVSVSDSILNSVKKQLGLEPSYDSFDLDIIMNINSAIATLSQLGVGPEYGYIVTGQQDTYMDYLGDSEPMFQWVKMYLYLKTRLGFDPPSNSFVLQSMKDQVSELEWRMKIRNEELNNFNT